MEPYLEGKNMTSQETLKNEISTLIVGVKDSFSSIDDHSDDSDFFYKLSQRIEWIGYNIDRVHCGYYIAIIEHTHYLLGFMTASQARDLLYDENIFNDDYCDYRTIKEVSPEIYDNYLDLIQIQDLYDHLEALKYKIKPISSDDFINDLKTKIEQLRSDIGLEHRWENVAYIHRDR